MIRNYIEKHPRRAQQILGISYEQYQALLKSGGCCKKAHKAYAEICIYQHNVSRMTKAYPSNLTWEQWELVADLFPSAKPGGRPRTVAMYAVINAILYVLCKGCKWRALPGDFPAWSTVYGSFRRWRKDATWIRVHDKLYQWVRVVAEREPTKVLRNCSSFANRWK